MSLNSEAMDKSRDDKGSSAKYSYGIVDCTTIEYPAGTDYAKAVEEAKKQIGVMHTAIPAYAVGLIVVLVGSIVVAYVYRTPYGQTAVQWTYEGQIGPSGGGSSGTGKPYMDEIQRELIKQGITIIGGKIKAAIDGVTSKEVKEKTEDSTEGTSGSTSKTDAEKERDKLLEGAEDTTSRKGQSKNYEKGGGDAKAQEDFDSMKLKDVKDIKTKYGPGKVGTDSDGNKVIYRPGSSEGPPTLEIQLPGGNKIKIRY